MPLYGDPVAGPTRQQQIILGTLLPLFSLAMLSVNICVASVMIEVVLFFLHMQRHSLSEASDHQSRLRTALPRLGDLRIARPPLPCARLSDHYFVRTVFGGAIESRPPCSDMYELGTGTVGSLLETLGTISYFNLMLFLPLVAANRYFAIAHAVKVCFGVSIEPSHRELL